MTARPIRRELDRLLATDCDRDNAWRELRLAHLVYGPCTVKETVSGDGVAKAVFRLESGDRDMWLDLGT